MEFCEYCGELLEQIDIFDKGYCEEIFYECPQCGNLVIIEVPK